MRRIPAGLESWYKYWALLRQELEHLERMMMEMVAQAAVFSAHMAKKHQLLQLNITGQV